MYRPRSSSYPFKQIRPENDPDEQPARSALLRLLDPESNVSIDDPELRRELVSMVELMERLESLAEQALQRSQREQEEAKRAAARGNRDAAWHLEAGATGEFVIAGRLVRFTPLDDETTTLFDPSYAWDDADPVSGQQLEPDSPHDRSRPDEPIAFPFDVSQIQAPPVESPPSEDNLERWWIHFNGDISLERLSRVRKGLEKSPFTIDARFSEIVDGLIVMRLVTERNLSTKQVDWVLGQVMEAVGLDRKAAIVSRN